jgi:hypothetical protein
VVLVLDAAGLSLQARIALPGNLVPGQTPLFDAATGMLYVPVRMGAGDAVAQVDAPSGSVRQSLPLAGRLAEGRSLCMLEQARTLVAAVVRPGASDALQRYTELVQVPARAEVHDLPGKLHASDAGLSLAPDGRRIAAVVAAAAGAGPSRPALAVLAAVSARLAASEPLPGRFVGAVPALFSDDSTRLLVLSQDGDEAVVSGASATTAAADCTQRIGGKVVSGVGPAAIGAAGYAHVLSQAGPMDERLTIATGAPAGTAAIATASNVAGSRLTLTDFQCRGTQFLLLPGAVSSLADGS